MIQPMKTSLCAAEMAYEWYVKQKGVGSLTAWFRKEVERDPDACRKFATHADEMLQKHSRHMEEIARGLRQVRLQKEVIQVA